MAGVTWTEETVSEVSYHEGTPQGTIIGGFALFGMPIPLDGAQVWADSTASFTERTVSSASYTEKTVSSASYTERSV